MFQNIEIANHNLIIMLFTNDKNNIYHEYLIVQSKYEKKMQILESIISKTKLSIFTQYQKGSKHKKFNAQYDK